MKLETISIASTCLVLAITISAQTKKETTRMTLATGPFEVKIQPQSEDKAEGSTLGRYSLEKVYHGDLEGTAKGEMLTATGSVETSGSYVAIERVVGKLHGREGSFALAHKGTMANGSQHLDITVVPDSGSGGLAGISGTLKILIAADGKHSYEIEYSLP